MADALTFARKNGSPNFRIRTASTKVTQSEFAELEHAAAEHGLRRSEWIREVLFRELPGEQGKGVKSGSLSVR